MKRSHALIRMGMFITEEEMMDGADRIRAMITRSLGESLDALSGIKTIYKILLMLDTSAITKELGVYSTLISMSEILLCRIQMDCLGEGLESQDYKKDTCYGKTNLRSSDMWRALLFKDASNSPTAAYLHIVNLHVNDGDLQNYVLYELEMLLSSNSNSPSLSEYGLPMPPPQLLAQFKDRLLMEDRNYNRVTLAEEHAILMSKDNQMQDI
ncbi:hypothetical protein Tco_0531405 [Tanacetum coccineum]